MRLFEFNKAIGVLEFNYMWVPTCIGMNSALKAEIEELIAPLVVNEPFSADLILKIEEETLKLLYKRFPGIDVRKFLQPLLTNAQPHKD